MTTLAFRNLIYIGLLTLVTLSLSFSAYFAVQAFHSDAELSQSEDFKRPSHHFVLIPEEMDNPYWHQVEKGAKAAASRYDAVVEYDGPVQASAEDHMNVMKKAIASKVDGIITQGLSKDTTPVINNAIQHGIPVVTVDTDAKDSRRQAYIGTNNYHAGKRAGRTLIKDTGGKAKVGIITGSLESAGQKARVKGFRDAIRAESGIKIAAVKPSHISEVQAAEKAYQIFVNHTDVDAYFGTSALDGIGISAAMQSLGQTKDTYILAFDKLPQTLKLMEDGSIDATIAQKPYAMGYQSVKMMAEIKNGKHIAENQSTGLEVIHPSDLPLKAPLDSTRGESS